MPVRCMDGVWTLSGWCLDTVLKCPNDMLMYGNYIESLLVSGVMSGSC